jgi:hypothetical protein
MRYLQPDERKINYDKALNIDFIEQESRHRENIID